MWINPKAPGVFFGNCAEYCGTQHANMLLRVVAQSPEDFKKWALEQQKQADVKSDTTAPPNGVAANKAAFESLDCVNCHMVQGTTAVGRFGPDLTHLMSRKTIGGNMIELTHKNLRDWVNDPQTLKPGCLMPSLQLTDRELDQVVAYLETLR